MPVARFEMPDGRVARFEVPEGTTPEQATMQMEQFFAGQNDAPKKEPEPKQTQQPRPKSGIARTAFDQVGQGATWGLMDEGQDYLGALGAKVYDKTFGDNLLDGQSVGDLVDEARGMSQERLANQFEDRPALSIGANLAGGLLTGGAASTTKAGTAVANSLRTGGTGARVAKGIAAGATSGGAYGFGAGSGGFDERLDNAEQTAIYGGAIGGAIPAAGSAVRGTVRNTKNAVRGMTARSGDDLDAAVGAVRDKANAAYQKMRDSGAVLERKASNNVVRQLDDVLAKETTNRRIHGNTLAVVSDLRKAAKKGALGLEELDQYRRLFGEMGGDLGNKSNARLATLMRNNIDDALDGLDDTAFKAGNKEALDALKQGRAEFARTRKMEMVTDIIKKSDGDANYVKRELKKLVQNPKKMRGFNQDERAALEEASRLGFGEGTMKMLGKFGIDFGNSRLGNTALPVIGGLATGSPVLPTVGTAARYGQKAVARGKAENALRVIEGVGSAPARRSALPGSTAAIAGEQAGQVGSYMDRPANAGTRINVYPGPRNDQRQMQSLARDFAQDEAGAIKIPSSEQIKDSLGTFARSQSGVPEIRFKRLNSNNEFRAYQKDIVTHYRQNPVVTNRDQGLDIRFTPAKVRKALHPNSSPAKLGAAPHVGRLMENAKLVNVAKDTQGRHTIENVLTFQSPVAINGVAYDAKIVVRRQENDGNLFYDYHVLEKRKPGSLMKRNQEDSQISSPDSPDSKLQNSPKVNDFDEGASLSGDLFDRIAMAESSGNPNAKAKTSSASGLFQFTDGTFRSILQKYGKGTGFTMKDKNDPKVQQWAMEKLTNENRSMLRDFLGQEPSEGALYLAHFAGIGGAKKLIGSNPRASAAQVLPSAAKANPTIFFDKGRRPRSVAQVIDLLESKVS